MVMRRRRAFTGPLLAVALTTLTTGVSARAQVPVVGVYAGINRATFDGSGTISGFDARDEVNRNAFQVGIFGSFPLSRYLAVNPAVGYTEMGTGLDRRNGIKSDVKLAYLEAPISLKLGIPLGPNGGVRPYLTAGPALGLELSCSRSGGLDCDSDRVNLRTKSLVFSGQLGAGVEVSRLFVEVKYQRGFSSIDDSGDALEIKNRVLAVVAGYGFRVGH
jgi:hypothetical protein